MSESDRESKMREMKGNRVKEKGRNERERGGED